MTTLRGGRRVASATRDRFGLRLLVLGVSLLAMTTGKAVADDAAKQEAREGALIYRTRCLSCHGENGAGDGPIAELLAVRPPDLSRLALENGGQFPTERVYRAIDGRDEIHGHGSREMPVWGKAFQDSGHAPGQGQAVHAKIRALVAYIVTLNAGVGPVPLPDPLPASPTGGGGGGGGGTAGRTASVSVEARGFENEQELQEWLDVLPREGKHLESMMPLETGLALLVLRRAPAGASELSYKALRIHRPYRQTSLNAQLLLHPRHRIVGVQTLEEGYLLILASERLRPSPEDETHGP